ncbi:uncharacterized protein BCR38DRAFT_198993 [Pseudomassariella vexata]|uniref:Zn(2)-C6 fungal-type domain-containing protein n=1 Tax=Pseudomassariella vexata TaxID=1141098 RepID=A0A1Y2E1T8_9PEZI|nr:uncharacterized protein BCR38DRAFT_198993 [Pseudomassariella vexata]ORY65513.1 hypothetical protein BCR38DRAFT_198993 [Pseudomassariella vexata]
MSDDESDDGRRASKKRKASRACDRCNSQHQPCDNAVPKCSVCERAGADCTYNRPVRKRGPRTGYTAQHGERLWGLVLQTNPGIEDLVLQLLANGTYGDTGISTADYFRNNDHQSELVKRFNESRLGRFVQTGEMPDVPTDKPSLVMQGAVPPTTNPSPSQESQTSSHTKPANGIRERARTSTTSGVRRPSVVSNPHGAPQNPGDIYILSEDVRKQASRSELPQISTYERGLSQGTAQTPGWQSFASHANISHGSDLGMNGFGALVNRQAGNDKPSQPPGVQPGLRSPSAHESQHDASSFDFDFPDATQWSVLSWSPLTS